MKNRIKEIRQLRKMSRKDVAEILEVDITTVLKWENSESSPPLVVLFTLSRLFDCAVEALFDIKYPEKDKTDQS